MPIPQAARQQIYEGTIKINRQSVRLDSALEEAREGILAMLALGVKIPDTDDVEIEFKLNSAMQQEQYRIHADSAGVLVEAGGMEGAVYAAATLAQLINEQDGVLPRCQLEDEPRFGWRGLLIDVCRHFFPMETLLQLVDLMAYYKYNRLHLHLTEDQGVRFESERFPLLNSIGSWRKSTFVKHAGLVGEDGIPHGGYYTKAELRDLVRYAKARGIEIVPEIDMPGHALSVMAAYPELACFEEPVEVATRFGVTDFSNKLYCAGDEKTFEFLFALLDEVLEVFPFSYIHIGGDEAVKTEWKRCKKCQAVKRAHGLKDERELQGYFLNRVIAFLESRGRKAIVWNDGLCDTLTKSAVCQYWTPLTHEGPRQIARYINAGGEAILSPVTRVYYDYPYAATPLVKTYRFAPMLRGVRKRCESRMLGVEACIWTEWIDKEEKLFFNTLPRLAVTAETGWAAYSGKNYLEFLHRLKPHYALYDRLGLTSAKHVEQPLPAPKRVRGVMEFVQKETHAELMAQEREQQTK